MITITNPGGLVIIVTLTKHENKRINNNVSDESKNQVFTKKALLFVFFFPSTGCSVTAQGRKLVHWLKKFGFRKAEFLKR